MPVAIVFSLKSNTFAFLKMLFPPFLGNIFAIIGIV